MYACIYMYSAGAYVGDGSPAEAEGLRFEPVQES